MKVTLIVGGKRTAVEDDEATAIVQRFQSQSAGHEVVKIDISCRQWKRGSIDKLQPFFKEVATSVRVVNLADIIAGLMTDEGLGVTETLAKTFHDSDLVEIELSDNAMGPRGLSRVESLFANSSHLQRLYLSNCGLSAESMDMLKTLVLADDGRIAKSLTDIVLDKNMIGVEGAKLVGDFLPACKKLQYLSYCGCRPVREGTKNLCDGILALTQDCTPVLRKLDLDDCTFGNGKDDAIVPFAEALKKCSQLRYLNMKDAELEIDGLALLVEALKISQAMPTHLYLDGCGELGTEGAVILRDYIASHATSLECLHLDLNELGDEGVSILLEAFAASRNVLEELSLAQNEIEQSGADALVRAQLPNLKKLILEDNDEMPKRYIKAKYGDVAVFGEEDEDDEAMGSSDQELDFLISQFNSARI